MKQQINNRIFFIALLVLFVCNSQGATPGGSSATNTQTTTINPTDSETSVGTQAAAASVTKPFLWRIENAAGKPCYLFGSIHLGYRKVSTWPNSLKAIFRNADAVYFEIPFDQETMAKIAAGMSDPANSLSKTLPPALYSRAAEKLKQIAPALNMSTYDALGVIEFGVQLMALESVDSNSVPLDILLYYQSANLLGKHVGGLETVEEEFSALRCLNKSEEVECLRAMLDYMDVCKTRGRTAGGELIDVYLTGDMEKLTAFSKNQMSGCSESTIRHFEEAFLTKRNQRFAERIAKKLRQSPEQSQVFVLGALHFGEPDSVLEFLRKEGFKSERVTSLQ